MIECKNLSVSYGSGTILRDISLTARSGEITVILGRNGCGKTTLFRAVSGNLGYAGYIGIDGTDARALSATERAGRIAVMPQMLRSPDITVRELVSFGRQPYTGIMGILSRRDRQTVEDVIARTGLTALADRRLNCISGGERQKAYFALLLAQETPNLLLDEPGAHLDASYTGQLMTFLREEKNSGKTVLSVLHDINRATDIADKIIVVHDGGIIFEGSRDAFCDSRVPEEIFGLRKYLCMAPNGKRVCYL